MMQLIEIESSECFSSEARLLLREFSHRINNEFTSAIGAISIAARSANNEAKAALAAVQDQRKCTTPCNCQNTAVASTRPHISSSYAGRSAVPSLTVRASSFGSWNAHSEWIPSAAGGWG